jgi:hypothetical protein
VEPVVAALVLTLYFQLDLGVVELLADLGFGERLGRDQVRRGSSSMLFLPGSPVRWFR